MESRKNQVPRSKTMPPDYIMVILIRKEQKSKSFNNPAFLMQRKQKRIGLWDQKNEDFF